MPGERRCANCGRHYWPKAGSQRYCSVLCRETHVPRLTGRSRYGAAHQRLRKQLEPAVATGGVSCVRCGQPIEPGESWDLEHSDKNPRMHSGVGHSRCNRATSAHVTNGNGVVEEPPLRWSQRWFDDPPVGTEVFLEDGLREVHVGGGVWQTVAAG